MRSLVRVQYRPPFRSKIPLQLLTEAGLKFPTKRSVIPAGLGVSKPLARSLILNKEELVINLPLPIHLEHREGIEKHNSQIQLSQ